ncbi:MAG: sensor histidine kinase [Bacteroidia bacterium]
MKKLWQAYRNSILKACSGTEQQNDGTLSYWQNLLFANTMIFILPFSIIAMLPAFYLNLTVDITTILFTDLSAIGFLLVLSFGKGIDVKKRKLTFTILSFVFAWFLLLMIDNPAPGSIYLFAATIFAMLMYEVRYAYYWCHITVLIYLLTALLPSLSINGIRTYEEMQIIEWVAVVSNVVFLSYLSAGLLPRLLSGIQQYIVRQNELQQELQLREADLREASEKLQFKNQELQDFVYIASHDLQEPLRMVSSFMGLLEKKHKAELPEKAHAYIHFAVDGANRMRKMLNDLLQYSRAGNMAEEKSWIKLDLEMAHFRQLFASDQKHELSWDPLPVIYGPKTPILQLFQNLISNGFKYGPETGVKKVHIGFEQNGHLQFTISDNGIGIAAEDQEAIFQLFKRVPTLQNVAGSGIGLAICKKIVGQLDGSLHLSSEIGKGSSFCVRLPKQTPHHDPHSNFVG